MCRVGLWRIIALTVPRRLPVQHHLGQNILVMTRPWNQNAVPGVAALGCFNSTVCVCMCARSCACMRVRLLPCVHACMHACMCVCVRPCVLPCVHRNMCAHICASMLLCMLPCVRAPCSRVCVLALMRARSRVCMLPFMLVCASTRRHACQHWTKYQRVAADQRLFF